MEITSAQFIKGIRGTDDILEQDLPHVAFIGRSNVGKSSSINALLGRNKLVKSSGTPGKTKEINFFLVNKELFFVDLPGYGYAKLGKQDRDQLRKLINWYLFDSGVENRTVVVVIDIKAGITEHDDEVIETMTNAGMSFIILANKIDKLNQKEKKEAFEKLGEYGVPVIPFSAVKKRGIKDFYTALLD